MSKEAVRQLFEAANQDPALQQKLENVGSSAEGVKIGAEHGYNFTEEEAQAFLAEHGVVSEGEGPEGELSEDALEAVAGGWFDNWRIRVGGW